jgi:alpha-beta hydrolase superfamily lysophospholipase
MSQAPTTTPFTSADGHTLAVYDWAACGNAQPRGVVLVAHGLGEHALRYQHVAQQLNEWGFDVRSYDHFGHGISMGDRGRLSHDDKLFLDLAEMLQEQRRLWPSQPRFLLGHSMGGALAADYIARQGSSDLQGLVLSSPALDPGLNPVQKLMLAVLPRVAPDLVVNNGLPAQYLARDPQVVQAYQQDPLVHNKVSARLARYIARAGQRALAAAPHWPLPTLLMYAGEDRLVSPKGSKAFAQRAPSIVQTKAFGEMYHEIFNDTDKQRVFAHLRAWLNTRCEPFTASRPVPRHVS